MQRVLVLNQDYTFLGLTDWQNAICAVYTQKAIAEEHYDWEVHSPSTTMKVPAVIRLKKFAHVVYERIIFVSFTKRNVHLRDRYICQYCAKHCEAKDITIDHVVPEDRGGLSTWENCVSSCSQCNSIKDNRTLEEAHMHLIHIPTKPRRFSEIVRIKCGELHDLWLRYLGT